MWCQRGIFGRDASYNSPWCQWQKFPFDTTKCGVEGEFLQVMPPKIHLRHHILWCRRLIFAIDTTICDVEGEFLPLTPQFVVPE